MLNTDSLDIFRLSGKDDFLTAALEVFRYQAIHCSVYADFIKNLDIDPLKIRSLDDIPFLPIEFFKSHDILADERAPQEIFSSSGTTGMSQSRHLVTDVGLYIQSFRRAFELFYGDIRQFTILALLPSYLEREGSSLIYMADDLISRSGSDQSGYFLHDHKMLHDTLLDLKRTRKHTLLIGVTYALLDFAESHSIDFPELIVMETGGMKGKRREMVRAELHQSLCSGFGVPVIHSEYGMTELLSQAYSKGAGIFHCPPWMDVRIRDTNDPLTIQGEGQTGGINVIDLANMNSCSFIATQDLGKKYPDGTFEVLGRFDNSDIRGCNLLVQ